MQHLLRVAPVIGILSNKNAFMPTLNAAEVEAIFDAPLEMFIKVLLFYFCFILVKFLVKTLISNLWFRMRIEEQRRESGWVKSILFITSTTKQMVRRM